MKNYIILLFFILLFSFPAIAEESDEKEIAAFHMMMTYCIPAVVAADDAARLASENKAIEFPAEKAQLFSKEPARVFTTKEAMGNSVLITRDNGMCSVAIRALDYNKFWEIADGWFGSETPFKKISEEKGENDSLTRTYQADFKGNILVLVSARSEPLPTGMQGMISASRIKD